MKKVLGISILCLLTCLSYSQNYMTALGVRGGIGSGITVKQNIGGDNVVEGILYYRGHVRSVVGLYEKYFPFSEENFYWFVGAGGHIGLYEHRKNHKHDDHNDHSTTTVGIDLIVGVEYVFEDVPFNISIDYKPEFNLIGHDRSDYDGVGVSVRYYW